MRRSSAIEKIEDWPSERVILPKGNGGCFWQMFRHLRLGRGEFEGRELKNANWTLVYPKSLVVKMRGLVSFVAFQLTVRVGVEKQVAILPENGKNEGAEDKKNQCLPHEPTNLDD
jgi:hypothetical protein